MRLISTFIASIVLSACVNGHQQFYKPFVDAKTLPEVQMLNKDEKPVIFSSNDMDRDVKVAASKGYVPIGFSSFNGKMASEQAVINQAIKVRAVLVLVNSKFTETRAITTPLFVPNNQTTYYGESTTGSVNGTNGRSNYTGNYSENTTGTSTSYGTTVVPLTTYQKRFDQSAVFFVKSTKKLKFGLLIKNITPELRTKYERNTGALIDVIAEDSPAFIANILPGDVLIEIDGTSIINAKHAKEIMASTSPSDGKCVIKVIRNGTEKLIELQLTPN